MHDGASSLTNANSVEITLPGGLPDGMTVSADGVLSGTPSESGAFEPEFVVVDDLDRSHSRVLGLTIRTGPLATADYDGDGDVDLADMAAFQACFGGAGDGACGQAFEFCSDEIINLGDFVGFKQRLTGP